MSTTETPPPEVEAKQPEEASPKLKRILVSHEQVLELCEIAAEQLQEGQLMFRDQLAGEADEASVSTENMLATVGQMIVEAGQKSATPAEFHRRLANQHAQIGAVASIVQNGAINNIIKLAMTLSVHASPVSAFVAACLSKGEYELRMVKVEKPAEQPAAASA